MNKPETKPENLESKVNELSNKVQQLENENVVLTDKVTSYEDPAKKPRIIPRGNVKPGVKFQKNNYRVKPTI